MIKLSRHLLQNRVSRKLLRRFFITSLLPIILFTCFVFYQVDQQTDTTNQTELENVSQALDYTLQDKLTFLSNELDSVANAYQKDGLSVGQTYQVNNPNSDDWFKSIMLVSANGERHPLLRPNTDAIPVNLLLKSPGDASAITFINDDAGNMFLSLQRTIHHQRLVFIASIEPLFMSSVFNILPVGTQGCIVGNQVNRLVCSSPTIESAFNTLIHLTNYFLDNKQNGMLEKNNQYYFAHRLENIDLQYGINWSIVLVKPKSWLVSEFLFNFPLVIMLSLLITSLIMIGSIRKLLKPLDDLVQASNAMKASGSMEKLQLDSHDEFEGLSDTLYHMSQRLNKHISALETMTNIDKLVLQSTRIKKYSQENNTHEPGAATLSLEEMVETLLFSLKQVVSCDDCSAIINERHNIYTATHFYMRGAVGHETVSQEHIKIPPQLMDILCEAKTYIPFTREELLNTYKTQFHQTHTHMILVPIFTGKDLNVVIIFYYTKKPTPIPEEIQQAADIGHRIAVILNNVASEDKLYHKAHFDALTNLPNRVLFHERLYQSLQRANRNELLVALLFVDLDAFKELNDTLGHSAGDEFLIEIAHRLENCTREVDTVARLGGDEFTVILPDLPNDDQLYNNVEAVAQKILDAVAAPFLISDKSVRVTVSIGIAIYPKDCDNVADLLKHADSAMYQAKNQGKKSYEFYAGKRRFPSTGTND